MSEYASRLRKSEWSVRPVSLQVAQQMVRMYHYAHHGANTATYCHGLFQVGRDLFDGDALGVAWWIPPTKSAAQATYPNNWQGVLCLSRLVIVPNVPKNACTFLLARSMRLIDRVAWPCLVTYADDWQGHNGTIYRAANWAYCGKTKPERTYLLHGQLISRKAGPHTRTHAQMIAMGCECIGSYAKHKYIHILEVTR